MNAAPYTPAEKRRARAEIRAAVAAFKASKHPDPAHRFATAASVLIGEMFKTVPRNQKQRHHTKGKKL